MTVAQRRAGRRLQQVPHVGRSHAELERDTRTMLAAAIERFPVPWFLEWACRWQEGKVSPGWTEDVMLQARAVALAALDVRHIELAIAATMAEAAALDALALNGGRRAR